MVNLAHGSGGKATHALVESVFLEAFANPMLAPLNDGAVVSVAGRPVAFTTDSFVVSPIFFPGGCLGDLAVNGTVNDLAACGAQPLALSAGFVIEEGFAVADLERVVAAMARRRQCRRRAHRHRRHQGGRTGQGRRVLRQHVRDRAGGRPGRVHLGRRRPARGPGDRVGPHRRPRHRRDARPGDARDLGRHRLGHRAAQRAGQRPARRGRGAVHVLRDATRGGVATVLNEVAAASGVAVVLEETALPVRPEVAGVCELLGLDPLYVACEGRMVVVVATRGGRRPLSGPCAPTPWAPAASSSAKWSPEPAGLVLENTGFGGARVVDMLVGDPLPRIC